MDDDRVDSGRGPTGDDAGGTSASDDSVDAAADGAGENRDAAPSAVTDGNGGKVTGSIVDDGGDTGGRAGPPADERTPAGWIRWFLTVEEGTAAYVRELLVSVLAVFAVGLLLFAISGVWPPMVAIESGSMEPHIQTGDLVFVMEEHRFPGSDPTVVDGKSTGVVTYRTVVRTDAEYTKFGAPGDVIVYQPNGREGVTPIIHRVRFWVNESENWYDKADPSYVGSASNCEELRRCPAPNAGFITKGDNQLTNQRYDQVTGISRPVKPAWIVGTAEFRIPLLGYIRLGVSTIGPGPGPMPLGVGLGWNRPELAIAGIAGLCGLVFRR